MSDINPRAVLLYERLVHAASILNKRESHHRNLQRHITKLRKISLEKGTSKEDIEDGVRELRKKIDAMMETERLIIRRSVDGDVATQRFAAKLAALETKINAVQGQDPRVEELRGRLKQLERKHAELKHKGIPAAYLERIQVSIDRIKDQVERKSAPIIVQNVTRPKAVKKAPVIKPVVIRETVKVKPEIIKETMRETVRISSRANVEKQVPDAPSTPSILVTAGNAEIKAPDFMLEERIVKPVVKQEVRIHTTQTTVVHHTGKAPKLRAPGPMPALEESHEMNKSILPMRGAQETYKKPKRKNIFKR
jgi:hypothetical protein